MCPDQSTGSHDGMAEGEEPPICKEAGRPLSVRDVVVTLVKPIEKRSHCQAIQPTFRDFTVADSYIPTFYAYRASYRPQQKDFSSYTSPQAVAASELVDRIRRGLQKVLVPFFPFAGRWVPTALGPGLEGRRLLCNDAGVPFIEAWADGDAEIDEVVKASEEFKPSQVLALLGYELMGLDVSQFRVTMLHEGLPSMFVQVTRFQDGGVVLAVCFNHMLTDGKSFYDFMRAWSNLSMDNDLMADIKPEFDRSLAKFDQDTLPREMFAVHPAAHLPGWDFKALQVKMSAVDAIKQEAANEAQNEAGYVSTVDCISAHMWRMVSKHLPPSMEMVAVNSIVEGRSRFFDPPVSQHLCGNITSNLVFPLAPPAKLQEWSSSLAARKIREKLRTMTREYWTSTKVFEEMKDLFMFRKDVANWTITSWRDFPMYDLDFGVGKPFFSSGPCSPASLPHLGTTYIGPSIPGRYDSAATVYIMGGEPIIQALVSDSEFMAFFL